MEQVQLLAQGRQLFLFPEKMYSPLQALSFAAWTAPRALGIGVHAYGVYYMVKNTIWLRDDCQKKTYSEQLNEGTEKLLHELAKEFVQVYEPVALAQMKYYYSKKPTIQVDGYIWTSFRAYIGIPTNFMYTKLKDVDLSAIKDMLKINSGIQDDLNQLRDTLVLSDNAKKFAIASAVHYVNNRKIPVEFSIIPAMTIPMMYLGGSGKFRPLYFHPGRQFAAVAIVATAIIVVYLTFVKIYYTRLQTQADQKAVNMGPEFFQGAMEYFDKTLEKNKILLKLDPSLEWTKLKSNGNERGAKVPLSRRQKLLQRYRDKKTEKEIQRTSTTD